MAWVVLIYLLLNPLFYMVNFHARDAQLIFYQLSSVAVFSCGMFFNQKPLKRGALNIWIGIFMITFCYAWTRSLEGWRVAYNLILGVLVYMTIIKTLSKEDIKFILKGLIILGIFCTVYLALQYRGFDIRGTVNIDDHNRIASSSIFYHNSAMGMFFAQLLPMAMSILPASALFAIPLVLSTTSGAVLGGFAGLWVFLWYRMRPAFWFSLLVIPIVFVCFLLFNERLDGLKEGFETRLNIWKVVLQDSFLSIQGRGLDSFVNPQRVGDHRYYQLVHNNKVVREIKTDSGWVMEKPLEKESIQMIRQNQSPFYLVDHPHNEYLWLFYECGIQSLIVLIGIMYFIWRRFKLSKRDVYTCAFYGSLVSIAIFSFFQFPFHLARIGSWLPFILGGFYIFTEET